MSAIQDASPAPSLLRRASAGTTNPGIGSGLIRILTPLVGRDNAVARHRPAGLPHAFTLYALSIGILVAAVLLSVLSAVDVDAVPVLRRFLATNVVTRSALPLDPSAGTILPVPGAAANFAHFDIDFTIQPGSGNPNLLQTAPGNRGLRIEASGDGIAALVADATRPSGFFGIPLASGLKAGQPYRLEVNYVERSKSTVALRDPAGLWTTFSFNPAQVDVSAPVFGSGFAADRVWRGTARLRSFTSGQAISHPQAEMILGVAWAIGSAALLAIILLVWAPMAARRADVAFAGLGRATPVPARGTGVAGDYLCVFRFLAFLAVAFGHAAMSFHPEGLQDTLRDMPGLALLLGCPWAGIWMFFVLSGYLMGKAFWGFRYQIGTAGIVAFFNNRLVKILPAYLAVFLFFGLLREPAIFKPENLFVWFRILTFNYIAQFDCRPLGSFWSISTEVQFYVVAPVLTFLLLRLSRSLPAFLALVLALVGGGLWLRHGLYLRGGIDSWGPYIYSPLYANLDLFSLGILAAAASRFLPTLRRSRVAVTGLGGALTVVTYAVASALYAFGNVFTDMRDPGNWTIWVGPTLIALMSLLTIMTIEHGYAAGGSRMPKVMARTIATLGALTYPLYLWFEPVLGSFQTMLAVKGDLYANLTGILETVAIAFLLAVFTVVVVEARFSTWRRNGPVTDALPPSGIDGRARSATFGDGPRPLVNPA